MNSPDANRPINSPGWPLARWLLLGVAIALVGCDTVPSGGELQKVWGRRGVSDGRFQKPRAIAIDSEDRLYIVDMTARIQVFDADGNFIRSWQTPTHKNGRPSGLSFDREGNLLVADTHYARVLVYTPQGKLLKEKTLGGQYGLEPGQFGLVTDAVQDSHGNYFVSEYGQYDRIHKLSASGEFLLEWGGHSAEPGQFLRPQNIVVDAEDRIWVADACNHRIQVFDGEGKLLFKWGEEGSEPGQLYYPYDLVLDGKGHLYVCEYGNHRVQKFTLDGRSLGCWGSQGRGEGQLFNPWALALDSQGRIHVVDSHNHRIQRIRL